MSDEYHPMHNNSIYLVVIGDVTLGKDPATMKPTAQPNPKKVTWSCTNDVVVHKIPYPAWRTMRTSKKSLYTLNMEFKTLRLSDMFEKIKTMCENVGPIYVKTYTKQEWMYVTDFSFTQSEGNDDVNIDWSINFQQVND